MNKTLDEIKASLDLGKMSSYELVESALAAIDSKTGEGTNFSKRFI
jgi:Asp-tRNA(Asn)/Glu-tRNA(Gln) amidotransferase A subunit family amidase